MFQYPQALSTCGKNEFSLLIILKSGWHIVPSAQAGNQLPRKSPYVCHSSTSESILGNSYRVFLCGFKKPIPPSGFHSPMRERISSVFESISPGLKLPVFESWCHHLGYMTLDYLLNFSKLQLVNWKVVTVLGLSELMHLEYLESIWPMLRAP